MRKRLQAKYLDFFFSSSFSLFVPSFSSPFLSPCLPSMLMVLFRASLQKLQAACEPRQHQSLGWQHLPAHDTQLSPSLISASFTSSNSSDEGFILPCLMWQTSPRENYKGFLLMVFFAIFKFWAIILNINKMLGIFSFFTHQLFCFKWSKNEHWFK